MVLLSVGLTAIAQPISLKECIRLGIANNLSLANARIGISKGRTGISQNRARLLPMINGGVQFTDYLKQPVNVTTGTLLGNEFPEDATWQTIKSMQYKVSAGVQLNVPLYNAGIYAAINVAETIEQLSHLAYEKAAEELTMQISKIYYLAQLSLEQTSLTEQNISRMNELCAITEAMYEHGLVLEIDFNRVKINLQNLNTLRNQYNTLYAQQTNMLLFC